MLAAGPAFAGGFSLEHQNAQALGVAFAGAESASGDAGFAAHNPSSLARVERPELSFNATQIWPSASYSGAAATLLGATPVTGANAGASVIKKALVPNLSAAAPLTDRITIGLVAHATYGFTTSFAEDSVVRYQARESELRAIEVTPVIAIEAAPGLRVGAGLRLQHLDLSLTSTIDAGGIAAASLVPGFSPGSSDLSASFGGSDLAVGFSVGLQADLSQTLHVGAAYASRIDHSFEGDAEFDLASSAAASVLNAAAGLFGADRFSTGLSTPASFAFGARYEATDRISFLASTKLTRWSSFDVVALEFNDAATPDETLTQNWKDSWSFSLGVEYAASPSTTVRAGVMYDESPVNGAYASPRIPDGDRRWIAAGMTQKLSKRLAADLGVAYASFSDRTIANDGTAPEDVFRGALAAKFETEVYAVSLRLRYRY